MTDRTGNLAGSASGQRGRLAEMRDVVACHRQKCVTPLLACDPLTTVEPVVFSPRMNGRSGLHVCIAYLLHTSCPDLLPSQVGHSVSIKSQ
jgi:hypothetical protein